MIRSLLCAPWHSPIWECYERRCDGPWIYRDNDNVRIFRDGNMWCAVFSDFVNLQESPAGFGKYPYRAALELERKANVKSSDPREEAL